MKNPDKLYYTTSQLDLDMDSSMLIFGNCDTGEPSERLSPIDALIKCVNLYRCVDMRWIADRTGLDVKETAKALKGLIYQNPYAWSGNQEDGWELAGKYLSGSLGLKLTHARMANRRYRGVFEDNITALERLLPKRLTREDLYVSLGSPLLTPRDMNDFINYLFKMPRYMRYDKTLYDEPTGTWELPNKSLFAENVPATSTYGTKELNGIKLLEDECNNRSSIYTVEIPSRDTKSGTKRVFSPEKSAVAAEKRNLIRESFDKWVWEDKDREYSILNRASNRFSKYVASRYDGRMLELPGLSEDAVVFPHVRNAVACILLGDGCYLLAMDTGSGKTYVMIISAMELIRLGQASKIMFVVPNHLVGQWVEMYRELYHTAKIRSVEGRDFTPDRIAETLEDIRDGDYEGIIIASSCFDRIPVSKQCHIERLTEELNELYQCRDSGGKSTARLRSRIRKAEKALGDAAVAEDPATKICCFDQLGIDRLYVDEAHNYKNLGVETSINGVYGISSSSSAKCKAMLEKVWYIQAKNHGGGVVMATGTPVTNSITDLYVMQKYLQNGALKLAGILSFDAWIGMFAEQKRDFELAVQPDSFRHASRFSAFHNIPQLTMLLSPIALFHHMDDQAGIPAFTGYKDIEVPASFQLKQILRELLERANRIHDKKVDSKTDNMLMITVDGRLAALDPRLVHENIGDPGITKASVCAEHVTSIYFSTEDRRSTQIIYCDTSTPKKGFNVYDELKRLLIFYGVKEEEVAYIHDANTPAKREKLFRDFREGKVRILIGSTAKLGTGVNVQNKVKAIHHLDIPWRPSDWIQREARAFRVGNENEEVAVYRYMTKGSFDAYSWQILETKQNIIDNLLAGFSVDKSCRDVDDAVLSFAEVKALTIGNPMLKKLVEIENEKRRIALLMKKSRENRDELEFRKNAISDEITAKESELEGLSEIAEYVRKMHKETKSSKKRRSQQESKMRENLREIIMGSVQKNVMKPKEKLLVRSYRGFDIFLPARMSADYPYVVIRREGLTAEELKGKKRKESYRVDLSYKKAGILTRIDNRIDGFGEKAEDLRMELKKLRRDLDETRRVLAADEGYEKKLRELEIQHREISKEIGEEK